MAENSIDSAEISRTDLKDLKVPASPSITDVQHLASYNWVEAPQATPTIAVPGSPTLWIPPTSPFRVPKDTGHFYIAQNAARHPDSPLEPLFRALYTSHPSFDINSINVVTDRNNIRKLLCFVNPRWSGYKQEDFTIFVEVKNNTAIFNRAETKTEEYIAPHEFRGYGHSFEDKCTRSQVNRSTGHHRIISYNFGGLKFLVRHETDGYVGAPASIPHSNQEPTSNKAQAAKDNVDHLSDVLDTLSLSPKTSKTNPQTTNPPTSKLTILHSGHHPVPLPSTLEIKTRVSHRPLAFSDVVSQLWVSQTPKLVRAYHTKGVFAVPQVEDVAGQVTAWEEQNQEDLGVLAALIWKIREVVRERGGRAVLRYDAGRDGLVFGEMEGRGLLPGDLYGRWDGGEREERNG